MGDEAESNDFQRGRIQSGKIEEAVLNLLKYK